jgi:hypothetical protein
MRIRKIALGTLIAGLAWSGLVMTGTGCAGSRYQRSTGAYIDDKSISTRVKTALFRDPMVSGFDVAVETFRGEVQLSGFVDTAQQKDRAAAVAREIEGVRLVTNNIEIKAPQTEMGTPGKGVEGSSGTVTEPAPDNRRVIDTESGPALERKLAPVQEGETNPTLDRNLDNDPLDLDDRDTDATPTDVRPLPPPTP